MWYQKFVVFVSPYVEFELTKRVGHKALLTSELADIFEAAPPAPNSVANRRVREAYTRATGQTVSQSAEETNQGIVSSSYS